jgi:hypothetical protein
MGPTTRALFRTVAAAAAPVFDGAFSSTPEFVVLPYTEAQLEAEASWAATIVHLGADRLGLPEWEPGVSVPSAQMPALSEEQKIAAREAAKTYGYSTTPRAVTYVAVAGGALLAAGALAALLSSRGRSR